MKITSFVIPTVIAVVFAYGIYKKVDIFEEFLSGAAENIKVAFDILPALIILMTCIGMLNTSGVVTFFTNIISPVAKVLGFPPQCLPLTLLRPLSGSGALAVYENIITQYHPDSFIGRVASVIMGSTETTFYTVAVYYGAAKVKNIRHTLLCAIAADVTGFVVSCAAVRLFM